MGNVPKPRGKGNVPKPPQGDSNVKNEKLCSSSSSSSAFPRPPCQQRITIFHHHHHVCVWMYTYANTCSFIHTECFGCNRIAPILLLLHPPPRPPPPPPSAPPADVPFFMPLRPSVDRGKRPNISSNSNRNHNSLNTRSSIGQWQQFITTVRRTGSAALP